MNALDNGIALEHPAGSVLVAYGLGQLADAELASIDVHLAECPECRLVVEGVVPDTLLTLLRSAATDADSISSADLAPNGVTQDHLPPDASIAPPAELLAHPRYRVGDLLGVGGMGAVYKAEHLLMERPVALKVLNRKIIDNPATTDRFRREVRAAARLTHPNIVAAFDAEQAGDVHFLVMEYVDGVSLARRAAESGPLPVAQACDFIRQAALGLQHAHERGMVHRDIKPQNLMLTPAGQIKILDFGLARFVMESAPADTSLSLEAEPAQGQEAAAIRLTHTGLVMGTPDYIAPEQARDSHLADIRADIYALGCTFYDLLAGQAPFPDGNAVHKVRGHLSRTPQPLDSLRRDVPPELIRIVERMMAKDPANRFQTPADVAAALTPFVAAPPPPRKKWPVLAAAAAFLAAIVFGAVIYIQTDNGRIVIETNDDAIAVMIQKAGGVKIIDQANNREYTLRVGEQSMPRGEYLIDVTEPLAGIEFQTKKFELKRGKEVRLTAKFAVEGKGMPAPKTLYPPKDLPATPAELAEREILRLDVERAQGIYQGKPARHWLLQFEDADPKLRTEAVRALGAIAQKRDSLIPTLISALRDSEDDVGNEASSALRKIGPAAFPAILEVLSNKKDGVAHERMTAALSMDRAKGDPNPQGGFAVNPAPVPLLVESLRIDDPEVRVETLLALGGHGDKAKLALPKLVFLFGQSVTHLEVTLKKGAPIKENSPSITLPVTILQTIEKIAPATGEIILYDTDQYRDPKELDKIVSRWRKAHEALAKLYPLTEPFARPITPPKTGGTGATDPNQTANDDDIYEGKPANFWVNQLRDGSTTYRLEAINALGGLVRRNRSYIPVLAKHMNDDDIGYRATMALSLNVGPVAFPMFRDAIEDEKSFNARRNAILAIGRIRQTSKEAIPLLQRALQSEDDRICGAAIYALGQLGITAGSAMPDLVRILESHLKSRDFFYVRAIGTYDATVGTNLRKGVKNGDQKEKNSFVGGHGPDSQIGANLLHSVIRLDPKLEFDLKQLETGVTDGFITELTEAEELRRWQKIHEVLKKKYPNPPAVEAPAVEPKNAIPRAPQTQTPKSDDFYQGKPASFWLNQLRDGDAAFRKQAVIALGGIAQRNKDFIPVLLEALKDPDDDVGRQAATSLAAVGEKAIPALLTFLRDEFSQPVTRLRAVYAVADIGPPAKGAVPLLIRALNAENPDHRHAPTFALGMIGPAATPAIPALVDLLETELNAIKKKVDAAQTGKTNPDKNPGFPAEHPVFQLCNRVIVALKQIDPAITEVLPAVFRKHPIGRQIVTMQDYQDSLKALKERYSRQIRDANSQTTVTAPIEEGALYLGKPAQFWIEQYQDAAPKFRVEAIEAIGNLAAKDKNLTQTLVAALKDKGEGVSQKACETLVSLGPDVVPNILIGVDQSSPRALKFAADAIGAFGPKGKAAVPLLAASLKLDDWPLRSSATAALGKIGPDAKAALPALVGLLGVALETKDIVADLKQFDEKKTPVFGGASRIPVETLDAMLKIESGIKSMLPEAVFDKSHLTSLDGVNLATTHTLWKQSYDTLKTRFPQPANEPSLLETEKGALTYSIIVEQVKTPQLYLGKPAQFWIAQYQDAAPKMRVEAIEAIGNLAAKDKKLIPLVVAGLKDQGEGVGVKAAEILGRLGPEALPDILAGVDRKSPRALMLAADAIGRYFAEGKAAVPMLTQALKLDDWPLRRSALGALLRIGPDAKPALPSLVEVMGITLAGKEIAAALENPAKSDWKLGPKDSIGLVNVLEAILRIDPEVKAALPEGIVDSGKVRNSSGINLAAPLPLWKQTHEALRKRYGAPVPLADPDAGKVGVEQAPMPKQAAGGDGPWYMGKPAAFWLKQMEDASPKFRLEAVEALGNIAEKNKSLAPALVAALKDRDYEVAGKAAYHLHGFGAEVIPEILKGVDESSPDALKHAADAIGPVGSQGKGAVPLLMRATKAKELQVSQAAIDALARIGPDAKPAIPAIVDVLGRSLEAKHVVDAIEYAAAPKTSKQKAYPKGMFGTRVVPAEILDSLLVIYPDIKADLPEGILNSGDSRSRLGVNLTAPLSLWKQTYEGLRKRYPLPTNDAPAGEPRGDPKSEPVGKADPMKTAFDVCPLGLIGQSRHAGISSRRDEGL